MFKIGDKVVCINFDDINPKNINSLKGTLTIVVCGPSVMNHKREVLSFKDVDGKWYHTRFRLAESASLLQEEINNLFTMGYRN